MPRQPDIKNKTNRLVYIPTNPAETKMSTDAKTLCLQDGITIRDFLSECLELGFKVHHWPPGNPQLQLIRFQESALDAPRCKCGKAAVTHGLHIPNGREIDCCKKCFSEVPQRYDVKLWSWRFLNE
jgi:hypothetical protein